MAKVLIIVADFYKDIADHLTAGASSVLDSVGVSHDTATVPGALEIAAVIKMRAERYDGFIALGAIIRGETYHFEVVSNESARALTDLAVHHGILSGNGILTCENMQQAVVRADPAQKNKGGDAAHALLKLLEIKGAL